jgi:hypothetical protein
MWYIIHAGVESGPLTVGQLVEKAVGGEILSEDLVKENNGLWGKARDVQYLQFLKEGSPNKQSTLDDHFQSLSSTIEIRIGTGHAILGMLFGAFGAVAFPGAFIYGSLFAKGPSTGTAGEWLGCMAFCFAIGGFGAWLFWSNWKQFFDPDPKLTIGPHALEDRRHKLVIPWQLIQNVRVQTTTTNSSLTAATMYLRVNLKNVAGEIPIDVFGMDRPYREIVELVRQRAATAWERLS